ncbi:hypothetical protein H8D36_00390 [archaeon]|nr:hypothetical protein [archaeon]
MKRGQITLFALLGIVLIIVVALIFLIMNQSRTSPGLDAQQTGASFFVKSCVSNLLTEGNLIISNQGGYIYPPQPTTELFIYNIPYFDDGVVLAATIEENLASYIDENMDSCIQSSDFEGLNLEGLSVTTSSVMLGDGGYTVATRFTYEGSEYVISNSKESAMNELLELAKGVLESYDVNEGFDSMLLSGLQSIHNAEIEIIPIAGQNIINIEKGESFLVFVI